MMEVILIPHIFFDVYTYSTKEHVSVKEHESLREGIFPQGHLCICCHLLAKFRTKFQRKLVLVYHHKKLRKNLSIIHTYDNLETYLTIEKAHDETFTI
jgi:hypothetical protein